MNTIALGANYCSHPLDLDQALGLGRGEGTGLGRGEGTVGGVTPAASKSRTEGSALCGRARTGAK